MGLALGTNWKFYTSVTKGSKLKFRKFWGLVPTFAEVTGEKLVVEGLPDPSTLIRIKANPKKTHFFLISNKHVNLNLDVLIIKTSKSERLLGVNIDHFLTFNEHVSKLCKKASQK